MTIDYPTELAALKDSAETVHSLILRLATHITQIRQHLDDLVHTPVQVTCRHQAPIGDYCAYCAETPEG